ncbi:hypothetical protein GGR51DRAFT_544455 [Nemania sp. FL0031]|nr:hypothetical protein GGR51DRAFT_544455 [Nemania sp. FL0031]
MSRPNKRTRQEINCDGCGCGKSECISCYEPPSDTQSINFSSVPSESSSYFASPYGRPPLPAPPTTTATPVVDYNYMISQLDENIVRYIVATLAPVSPGVQAVVASAYNEKMQIIQTQVIDFDEYSKEAWHILNTSSYTEGSGSKQFEASFDARSDVIACIDAIGEETPPESSYGTKLSAIETLRKIAKTILLAEDTLGSEVRKAFQDETCLGDIMVRIAESMTPEEQRRAGAKTDAKGSLATKLRWVCDEAKSYCLGGFDGLRDVLALIEQPEGIINEHDEDRL